MNQLVEFLVPYTFSDGEFRQPAERRWVATGNAATLVSNGIVRIVSAPSDITLTIVGGI